MKSNELAKALAPFALLANKHALSPAYRVTQLNANIVRGCSSYGAVELGIELPFVAAPKEAVYVDADAFFAVLKSLPAEDIKFDLSNGVLAWVCGSAKGRLALASIKEYPTITAAEGAHGPWEPTDEFYRALDLGGLSCTNVALTSAGMYGIVIDNREGLTVYSSDNITVAAAEAGELIDGAPDVLTFTPDAVELLRLCISYGEEVAQLYFSLYDVELVSGPLRMVVKQVPAMKHNFRKLLDTYAANDVVVPIPPERIAAFVKRATSLAESKRNAVVLISGVEGRLSLAFEEGTSSSEEYYLVENVQVPDIAPIQIDSARLARALAHVDHVILDHAARSVLVFGGGDDVPFTYLLSGRR